MFATQYFNNFHNKFTFRLKFSYFLSITKATSHQDPKTYAILGGSIEWTVSGMGYMNAEILIVDDDWLNVEVLEAYLQRDYTTCTVNSGEKALEYVKTNPPDVILMDVRMSGMDGYQATATLKDDPTTANIPVIIVTAFDSKKDVERAVDAGADDVLFKPIVAPLLLLRVRSFVKLKRLQDQLNG